MKQKEKLLLLTIIILHSIACYLFYTGFFPVGNHTILNNATEFPVTPQPGLYSHLVVMVIDALRTDFVFGETKWSPHMAFTQKMISENKTFSFRARGKPPTVTMPRLKALTSGSESDFSDIMSNAASNEFKVDNFITQFKTAGKPLIFYGDDTWLKMFPHHFKRSEGTTSFFVSDYTEIDENVTRHLDVELSSQDWNVMILHYLGLDHIGHLEGPYSHLVAPKLEEMDDIIKKIATKLFDRTTTNNEKSLLLICGDHGMSEAGSHGGASRQETETPFIFIDSSFKGVEFQWNRYVNQIDLASTLSLLYAINIPQRNTGLPINEFYHFFSTNEQRVHHQQLACQLYSNSLNILKDQVKLIDDLLRICRNNSVDNTEQILTDVATRLQELSPEYNEIVMLGGILLMIISTILVLILVKSTSMKGYTETFIEEVSRNNKNNRRDNLDKCANLKSNDHQEDDKNVQNFHEIHKNFRKSDRKTGKLKYSTNCSYFNPLLDYYYLFSLSLILLSLLSSSFMEEEQYVWYYITSSYFLLLTISCYRYNSMYSTLKLVLFLLIMRFARDFNRTGVKWISLVDVNDWLVLKENIIIFTVMLVTSFIIILKLKKKPETLLGKILFTVGMATVFFYKILSLNLFEITVENYKFLSAFIQILHEITGDNNVVLPRISYLVIAIMFLLKMFGYVKYHGSYWVILVLLLLKVHNIPWFSMVIVLQELFTVTRICSSSTNSLRLSHVYLMLAKYTFFAHGNSNSFSTIDIAAGLTGFREYDPIFSSILSYVATFSTCSYWLVSWLDTSQLRYKGSVATLPLYVSTYHIIEGTLLCFIIYLQRYHLFIWSVFAPRFFYYIAAMVWYFNFTVIIVIKDFLIDIVSY